MVARVPVRAIMAQRITQSAFWLPSTQRPRDLAPSMLLSPRDWLLYSLIPVDKVVNQKPTKNTHLPNLHVCTYTDSYNAEKPHQIFWRVGLKILEPEASIHWNMYVSASISGNNGVDLTPRGSCCAALLSFFLQFQVHQSLFCQA